MSLKSGVAAHWPWLVLVMVLMSLTTASWVIVRQGLSNNLTLARQSTERELQLITAFVARELNVGRYQEIEPLLRKWGAANQRIARLQLVTLNGFVLATYQRPGSVKHGELLDQPISYSYRGEALLRLQLDHADVYQYQYRLAIELAIMLAISAALLSMLLHVALQRRREALALRQRTEELDIARNALAETAERLHLALEGTNDGLWDWNIQTNMVYFSPRWEAMLGRAPNELTQNFETWMQLLHPDDKPKVLAALQAHFSDANRVYEQEFRMRHTNGTWVWVKGRGRVAEYTAAGLPLRMLGTHTDITERKKAQDALRESETRLLLALNAAKMGTYDWDIPNNHITWSRWHEELWGFAEGEFAGTYEAFASRLHPDDVRGIDAKVTHCMKTREPFSHEFRVFWPDGSMHWIAGRGEFTFGLGGEPLRMRGVVREVTEQKLAEAALKRSEDHFRTIFEQATDGIYIANAQADYLDANSAGCQQLGYTREELLKLNAADTLVADEVPRLAAEIARLKDGSVIQSEWWMRRKDGSLLLCEVTAKQLPDGRLQAFVRDITERRRAEQTIARLAYRDPLTDLPNRVALQERLRQGLVDAEAKQQSLALFLLNLNTFREINDTLGHPTGDQVLTQVAERLKAILWDTDMVARLAADEFAVLLPRLTDRHHIALIAAKITVAFNEPFIVASVPLDVQASVGVALYPEHGIDADTLFQHADVALHAAKIQHRPHVIYDAAIDHYNPLELGLMGELRVAIAQDELLLHFQPKLNLKTNTVSGVEALVRWQHPRRGFLPPDEFIPAAEKTGLIDALTHWLVKTALQQVKSWQAQGVQLAMAVNISARNLQDREFVPQMLELLSTEALASKQLIFEITESAIMLDPLGSQRKLNELYEHGVRFSIDDFGTGYSSLSYLKELPVSNLKIDKSFVIDFKDARNAAIVRSTIELAHNLNLEVTAEGVEDAATLRALQALGCEEAQGYYICRPLPPSELSVWLKQRALSHSASL